MSTRLARKQAEEFLLQMKKKQSKTKANASIGRAPVSPSKQPFASSTQTTLTPSSSTIKTPKPKKSPPSSKSPRQVPDSIQVPIIHSQETPEVGVGDISKVMRIIIEAISRNEDRDDELSAAKHQYEKNARERLAAGDRVGALPYIKGIRKLTRALQKTSAIIETFERRKALLESADCNEELLAVMKQVSCTMKKLENDAGIDRIDKMIAEIQDGQLLGGTVNVSKDDESLVEAFVKGLDLTAEVQAQ